jgi:hypothetical protein
MKKTFKHLSAGSALALLLAATSSAFALSVTPPGPGKGLLPFSAKGATTLSASGITIGCTAVLTGTIDGSGAVTITSASFSGNGECALVVPTATSDTPWTGNVTSPNQLALNNVGVNVEVPIFGGKCGPTAIDADLRVKEPTKETILSFRKQMLSGGCEVSGSLTTTPFLNIRD